jgi:hypothetical protein
MVSLYDIDQRTGTQRWNFTTQGAGYARPPPWPEAWSRTERMPDDGFIYSNHGFSSIEELENFHEAGFHPLEVIRAATLHAAAEILRPSGKPIEYGVVRPGMLADIIIVPENPIATLEVPCGNGFVRLNDQTNKVERAHGDATGVVPAVPDPGGLQRHDRGRG